jgi:peptidoglycan/xylan/chitin deacetylase (PgdA/CDA1 family)
MTIEAAPPTGGDAPTVPYHGSGGLHAGGSGSLVRASQRVFAETASRLLSAHRPRRLSILNFHRVLAEPDPVIPDVPDAPQFEALLYRVRDWFEPLPLSEALPRLWSDTLPPRAICVTFDDGYADNLTIAWPILRRLGIPATVFVASGFLDGGIMWNDRVIEAVRRCRGEYLDLTDLGLGVQPLGDLAQRTQALDALLAALKYRPSGEREALAREIGARHAPDLASPMLTRTQLKQLRSEGAEIGGHTVNHPILARVPDREARDEMGTDKEELEGLLGQRIGFFAYPNGRAGKDFAPIHAQMARALGYQAAVTTDPGVSTAATDRFRLRRFTPWEQTPLRFGLRLLLNMRQAA